MAEKTDIEELIKRKKKLEEDLFKTVEHDVRKFYEDTGFSVSNVIVSVKGATSEIEYVNCELFLG